MTEFNKNQLIFNINCIKKPPKVFLSGGLQISVFVVRNYLLLN